MALARYYTVVQDTSGNIVPGVSVTVKVAGTAVLATLFSDSAGAVPLANPFTNNATYGSAEFYTAAGAYDLTLTKVGYTFQAQTNVLVGRPVFTRSAVSVPSVNAARQLEALQIIPAGARVVGVYRTITTAFGASGGLTGMHLGDAILVDRWGQALALTVNDKSDATDFREGGVPVYTSATSVLISAAPDTATFDATGVLLLEVEYHLGAAS